MIYTYTNIYTYILCKENESKKNDSINSILQHGGGVGNYCCAVFPTSRFPYLILKGSYLNSYKN